MMIAQGGTLSEAIQTALLASDLTPRRRAALERLRSRAEDAKWDESVLFGK